jgi:hypothetical protein
MFAYNATLCACDPGYYLSNGTTCISLPTGGGNGGAFSDWQVGAVGAGSRNQTLYFLAPVLSLDVVRRLTQSQTVLLVAALITLLSWLAFCATARLAGRDPAAASSTRRRFSRARFWISRLDYIFDTQHWAVSKKSIFSSSSFRAHSSCSTKIPSSFFCVRRHGLKLKVIPNKITLFYT